MHDEMKLEAEALERFRASVRMAAERLSCEAQSTAGSIEGGALRGKMGSIARDLFQADGTMIEALRTLPPANTETDVERVADLREMLHDLPDYEGDDPRAGFYRRRREALLAAISALSLTRPAGGEELTEGAVLAWMRRTGRTSIALIEDVDAHIASLPVRSGEEELADIAKRNAGEPSIFVYQDGEWAILGSHDAAYEEGVVATIPLSTLPVSGKTVRVVTDYEVTVAALAILAADTDDLLSAEGEPEEAAEKFARAALATPQQVKEGERHG